jgi:mannitol-1-phosphate 5-dehydrogenase
LLSQAANDPELAALARAASEESGPAIAKYQNRAIVDPIERNTRGPLRKLARNDRLAGPACLAFESGRVPEALARAIAAALHYDHEGDSSACRLQQTIHAKSVAQIVREVCGIDPDQPLGASIVRAYSELKRVL